MKFGEHLKNNIAPEYGAEPYLAYERLDQIISQLAQSKPSAYVLFLVERSWCRYCSEIFLCCLIKFVHRSFF